MGSIEKQVERQATANKMKLLYLIGTVMAAGLISVEAQQSRSQVGVRAPARLTIEDCLCQCESQVFVDKFGRTNGNCKTADSTGKKWCYLKDVNSQIGNYRRSHSKWNGFTTVQAAAPVSTTCPDGRSSQQFNGKVYGYHACGTPELTDYRCRQLLNGGGNNGGDNGGGNNCGSWNNYCNGNNNNNNNNNNNCGSWNNYCNGNNNNNNCGSWNNNCNGNNNNNNNCNYNNNYCGRGSGRTGSKRKGSKVTSTRGQSSNKGSVSFVSQK